MSNKCWRCWVTCGAILLGLGVIVGAVAAHGLDERLQEVHGDKPAIERVGGSITAAAKALDDIRVGVRYLVWHALGMIAVGLAGSLAGTRNWPLQAAESVSAWASSASPEDSTPWPSPASGASGR